MEKIAFFWSGFEPILRILVVGTLAYIAIVFTLRIAGKRTLASMNAFDFIITIAIGSAFGRILTAKAVSIAEAVTAFVLLAVLQFVFSHFESRSGFVKRLVTSDPALLYYKGNFVDKNLRKERMDKNELLGIARKSDFGSMNEIEALILETDGSFSVIEKNGEKTNSTFHKLLDEKNS